MKVGRARSETMLQALEAELAELRAVLARRVELEQAKGTLSVPHGVRLDEAFATLRRQSRTQPGTHKVEVVGGSGEFLALAPRAATALADELHTLLMQGADTAEELTELAPSQALVHLKAALADAFVWLSASAREMSPTWQDAAEALRYEGAGAAGCGYNTEIEGGYSFAFREPSSGRTATVHVEAAAGSDTVLTEDAAHAALGQYLHDDKLPTRIVIQTDGNARRA